MDSVEQDGSAAVVMSRDRLTPTPVIEPCPRKPTVRLTVEARELTFHIPT